MFDLRYHVASLAAVFIAIAVGIVIGVAIASGGAVDEATKSFQDSRIQSLEKELDAERARGDRSEKQQEAIADVMNDVYPALMEGRLAAKRYALVFLGPIDGGVRSAVEKTLTDADSGSPLRVTALELPVDVDAIDEMLTGDPGLASYVGDARLGDLGGALARELAAGGDTPVWDLLSNEIVEQRTGSLTEPVDGVVVIRSWWPGKTSDPAAKGRASQTEAVLAGMIRELGELGVPAVGVESATAEESAVDAYRQFGVSSVDDVDTLPGRVALALLLAGGESGHYGIKDSASDGVTPPIEPLPVVTVAG